MKTTPRPWPAAAVALCILSAAVCALPLGSARQLAGQEPSGATFLLGFGGKPSRSALDGALTAMGCSLDFFHSEAGIATAKCPLGTPLSTSSAGLSKLGVGTVVQDFAVASTQPAFTKLEAETGVAAGSPNVSASASFFTGPILGDPNDRWWPYQWAPRSIGAPAAWSQGINGKCVRVGVVDGSFGTLNPDLVNKFDLSVTKSFADIGFQVDTDEPHGQWVSGVIGAEANNGFSVAGVAYGSTLIGVQVFGTLPSAPFSTIVQGILYAAERKDQGGAGADIINLSLSGTIIRSDRSTRADASGDALPLLNRVFAFANKNGVLVVAAAGNDASNFDFQRSALTLPCESPNVICVAANAPLGICPSCSSGDAIICDDPPGLDFAGADYNRLASYTNYGRAVDVTAPGGDFATFPAPCWADDLVATTYPFGFTVWVAGTSFSAPHVSALAALYIQKAAMDQGALESELCAPGRTTTYVSPAEIKAAILRGAVLPPGTPGQMRNLYGAGIINVPRTLGL
ncbi:hypothetical protein HYH03_016840 [Edaphochlamys debaryana]|uniref:Peptidase S8/S53 domain-containing protein n=1 Tax=Edaphochlamys debaryana TaxID=47281 RepID=A0A835XQI2_9CHLO|nr:hypothetical protein HYH03_016840 [Edaphochlamys debaryana]|eukprot:KAG2484294.1 hypothetical protein HYH03_016840 [Edaphochlamys debaryana]